MAWNAEPSFVEEEEPMLAAAVDDSEAATGRPRATARRSMGAKMTEDDLAEEESSADASGLDGEAMDEGELGPACGTPESGPGGTATPLGGTATPTGPEKEDPPLQSRRKDSIIMMKDPTAASGRKDSVIMWNAAELAARRSSLRGLYASTVLPPGLANGRPDDAGGLPSPTRGAVDLGRRLRGQVDASDHEGPGSLLPLQDREDKETTSSRMSAVHISGMLGPEAPEVSRARERAERSRRNAAQAAAQRRAAAAQRASPESAESSAGKRGPAEQPGAQPAPARRRLCAKTADSTGASQASSPKSLAVSGPAAAAPPPGAAATKPASEPAAAPGTLPPGAIVPLPPMIPAGMTGKQAKMVQDFVSQAQDKKRKVGGA